MSGMHSDPQVRFICDQNLGKLAKWLRILGFDAEYMSHWDNEAMMQAMKNGRIMLTRKSTLSPNKEVVFITHDLVREQLKELFTTLDLRKDIEPFTRCSLCNTPLVNALREEVKGRIPEYVYATQGVFARCPSCGRVYWEGTHISRISDLIDFLLKDEKA